MSTATKNFVLFKTDLFVFRQRDEDIDRWCVGGDCAAWFYVRLLLDEHIQRDFDPIMEDWGWTFAVAADDAKVRVNVWAFSIENCWLFGLLPEVGWFQSKSSKPLLAAKDVVANALDTILGSDSRISKRGWFTENPFDLSVQDF